MENSSRWFTSLVLFLTVSIGMQLAAVPVASAGVFSFPSLPSLPSFPGYGQGNNDNGGSDNGDSQTGPSEGGGENGEPSDGAGAGQGEDRPPADEGDEGGRPEPGSPIAPSSGSPIISLSFDDGLKTTYTTALPVLQQYGMRGTVYVYPQAQDEGFEGSLTWDDIRDLQNTYDWEVGSHSYSHARLTQLSRSEVRQEIIRAVRSFRRQKVNVGGFASPYGEYNDEVLQTVSRVHLYHRNAFGGTFNSFPYNDYNLNGVEVTYDMSVEEVKALVDQAIAKKTWIILYWHDFVDGDPIPYTYRAEDFKEIVAYIAQKQVAVLPVQEALEQWAGGEELVANGSFEEGIGRDAVGWTRSDKKKVRIVRYFRGNAPAPRKSAEIRGAQQQVELSSVPIVVDDRSTYRIRMFWRMQRYQRGSGNIWISEFNSNGAYIGGTWLGGISKNGVETRYAEYTPRSGTAQIEIFFYASAGSSFVWNIDSVSMRAR